MCDFCVKAKKMSIGDALQALGAEMGSPLSAQEKEHLLDLADSLVSDGPDDEPELVDIDVFREYERRFRE